MSGLQGFAPLAIQPLQTRVLPDHSAVAFALLIPLLMIAAGVLAFSGLRWVRRVGQRPDAEWSARAAMDELCPHGWQARLTVYGSNAPPPADAPAARRPQVSVDWAELSGDPSHEVAVVRRVWAPDIAQALNAMVEDRRTDVTLEQIEAMTGGEEDWPA